MPNVDVFGFNVPIVEEDVPMKKLPETQAGKNLRRDIGFGSPSTGRMNKRGKKSAFVPDGFPAFRKDEVF